MSITVLPPHEMDDIKVLKPVMLEVTNFYSSFDPHSVPAHANNLAPIKVLGLTDPIPSDTEPGTVILRLVNTNLEGNNA